MYRVKHRELSEQRAHGTAVLNVFHCTPPLHFLSLFRSLRQRHYDYPIELFLLPDEVSDFPREIIESAAAIS